MTPEQGEAGGAAQRVNWDGLTPEQGEAGGAAQRVNWDGLTPEQGEAEGELGWFDSGTRGG